MAVYLFTFHAYQSWMPDHRRGYVREGKVLAPDAGMAKRYRERATQEANWFDEGQQRVMLSGVYDVCRRRDWRLHGFAGEPTHVHVIISWRGYVPWEQVRDRVKNLLSLFLGRAAGIEGRKWFSRDASRKRVRDSEHLDHLLDRYLPKHGGLVWREGDERPPGLEEVLAQQKPRASARG